MATGDPITDAYYGAVLRGIGAPVTPANLAVMRAWHKAEGGWRTAKWNAWNTTQQLDRTVTPARQIPSTPFPQAPSVRSYGSFADGVAASVSTLQLPAYAEVVSGFRANNPAATVSALIASPWAASRYGARQIAGQYQLSSSTVWQIFQQDPAYGTTAVNPQATPADPNPSWWAQLADNLIPDNLGQVGQAVIPVQVRQGFQTILAIQAGIGWVVTNFRWILLALLGAAVVGTAVLLAVRGQINLPAMPVGAETGGT